MKYYVVADLHGFFSLTKEALTKKGFFDEKEECKLIICGDVLDRGEEARELEAFILELMKKDRVILIRGNHEDLLERMLDDLEYGELYPFETGTSYHMKNGTWQTALMLSGLENNYALSHTRELVRKVKSSDFYKKIMPEMRDFFETENYVFVHGYIPAVSSDGNTAYRATRSFSYNENWRNASKQDWENARWYNGMEFCAKRGISVEGKDVVCGHWHCSYGHAWISHICSEFGKNAIFEPFYGEGVIGIDACTVFSKQVNCIIIED